MAAAAAAAPENDPFARDLLVLTDWFEGEFDNEEQRWFQADPRSNTPEDERHVRVHATHKRIEAPEFGEHVFYVEEYTNNDPEKGLPPAPGDLFPGPGGGWDPHAAGLLQ